MARVQWIGQSATARSSSVGNLRLLNGYAEVVESQQGKAVVALYGAPGLTVFTTLPGSGGVRAVYTSSDSRLFAVRGAGCYEVYTDGTTALLGTLSSSSGPVSMADNGVDILVVDGPSGYALSLAGLTWTPIVSAGWRGSARVDFLDGYFLLHEPGTGRWYVSDLYSTTFDPLDFATEEARPDPVVSLLRVQRDVWLFGSLSTGIWGNVGGEGFPFTRNESVFLEHGCLAAHSPALSGQQLFWLSQNASGQGLVLTSQGYLPQRISTHPVELALQGYSTVTDAIGFCQQDEGHVFYWLTFPTANATWVYDATTGLWAERAYRDPTTGAMGRHRASCYTVAFGRQLVGDYATGAVYQLGLDTYTDNGAPLVFEAILPPVFDGTDLNNVQHRTFKLDCETGVGLVTGSDPALNPQVVLDWSNDGGQTWGTPRPKPLGALGQYGRELEWRQLGMARDRRYRVRITAPVKRAILGAYVTTEGLLA